jgi:RNA polymerase sigma-70 factor (ECF subfamily)
VALGDGEALRAALADLPPEFREAVVLREPEGMSYKEVAAVTGVPMGTVMSRLSRGRGQIRQPVAGRTRVDGRLATMHDQLSDPF